MRQKIFPEYGGHTRNQEYSSTLSTLKVDSEVKGSQIEQKIAEEIGNISLSEPPPSKKKVEKTGPKFLS